jgi:hypothetical protein
MLDEHNLAVTMVVTEFHADRRIIAIEAIGAAQT